MTGPAKCAGVGTFAPAAHSQLDATMRCIGNAGAEDPAFEIDILVQGFPGKTVCHGGLGWSTVALLRGRGRRSMLVDAGSFNMRRLLIEQLRLRGLTPAD